MTDIVLDIDPTPGPRMTRRDRFAPSKSAQRYFKFCNKLRALAGISRYQLALPLSITFVVEMPKSWSKKKKEKFNGELKPTRPDLDNYIKSFQDALAGEDGWISHYGEMKKIYGYKGQIIIHTKE